MQIVHARVEDEECLGLALFHIDDAAHQHAGIGRDQPARLEDQLRAQIFAITRATSAP